MREPLMPRPWNAPLRGGTSCGLARDDAQVAGGQLCAEPVRRGLPLARNELQPDLAESRRREIGEQADAVASPHDVDELPGCVLERQVLVNVLADLERRDGIERQCG